MSELRRCSRPGCGKPAVATLRYSYANSTAEIGPLGPGDDPHSWDLCERHAQRIKAPQDWQLTRRPWVEPPPADSPELLSEEDDLLLLARVVRESGGRSGLVSEPLETLDGPVTEDNSRHPAQRPAARKRAAERRHLRAVPDPE